MKKLGLIALFLLVVAVVGGTRWLRLYDPQAIYTPKDSDLYLRDTQKLAELSRILSDSLQAIEDEQELKWAGNLLGWRTFQPGHYDIDSGYTYDAFLSKLAKGNQDPIALTIVPGQSKEKIISFLAHRMRFDSLDIHQTINDSSFFAGRRFDQQTLVGYLFPATYDLYWTSSAKSILERFFSEFNKQVINAYRDRMDELDLTTNEVLALASIIEWEAIHDDEKPKISGLYWNRLNRGMLLQADPTVSYAVGERRRLYFKDYKVDHPYNTYQNKGLPPGPINNPSLSSIKAALYPMDHEYLYMVARPNGYHEFSETYAEHQQKSAEWREYLKNQEKESSTSTDSSSAGRK